MIYIIDNIFNFLIYLFIIYFGFRLRTRQCKFFIVASVVVMLLAGVLNAFFNTNSPFVYIVWTVLSICLFFEGRLVHLFVISLAIMYFTGIVDTFSVMLIQIVLIGRGGDIDITWWMEPAYLISFLFYLLVYIKLLKKHKVFMDDIELKYKFALLVQGSIFQIFYNFVFTFFNENHAKYEWNAYVVFFISIIGGIYSIFLTLSLAIKNILSNRQNGELQEFMYMQKQQYEYQLQQSISVRRFKHDLVNHIGALRELINQKRIEEAAEYVDTIWNIQDEFDLKIHTGDTFLDVIINYYLYLAEKRGVEFKVTGKVVEKLQLEMFDITTLMGNILQNAIEATVKADVPQICVELLDNRKEIFFVVSNSIAQKMNTSTDCFSTTKEDKMNHGFGMQNIAFTVEKYNGEHYMDIIMKNGIALFRISVAIPRETSYENMHHRR